MHITAIAGARPNFVKIAALTHAFRVFPELQLDIIHTGQHYDECLDGVFFRQLEIPPPETRLGISGEHPGQQLAHMLTGLEKAFLEKRPDLVMVVGDTRSTMAGALAASALRIPVAHVEAGLRSGDRGMPEEINRIVADAASDLLFATEQAALDNLQARQTAQGKRGQQVFLTGNCMIDTLLRFREQAGATKSAAALGLRPRHYVLVTLHRPSNVDTPVGQERMWQVLESVCRQTVAVFPMHPRTRGRMQRSGWLQRLETLDNLLLLPPQGYLEFLNLMENAALIMTDSGGIQDETTFLGIPCLTLRDTTERPVTVAMGTNELLVRHEPQVIQKKIEQALSEQWKRGTVPPLWDGQSGRRIAEILIKKIPQSR
ncbi:MAG: UDP-N-acetylglucosamine 2-epimerase (non-hydrolyzing) [Saprospiraceae bacterium]